MKRIYLPTLAAALICFVFATSAAHGQSLTLNSGDIATVDGTGTQGTIGGTPVANAATTYTADSYYAVQTNGTAAFTLGTGGTLSGIYGLNTSGSGLVTVSGGTINGTGAYGVSLYTNTSSTSPIAIMGGAFTSENDGFVLFNNGTGPITITGGTFTPSRSNLIFFEQAQTVLDLYGTFDGFMPGQAYTLPSSANGTGGSFTGTLQNNTTAQTYTYLNRGMITLHDVGVAAAPEPSQFAALSIGILGLGILALRARRRAVA